MRLELKEIGNRLPAGPGRTKWFFETGRRTLGRSSDCDWQIPEEYRSVSKLHCTIERDRDGFFLRDQSANGSKVDGAVVHEGETTRLSDQSQLDVGVLSFSIQISGEAYKDMEDPDAGLAMSDERLTISSILSDIAPGGRSAGGILGGRGNEAWLEIPKPEEAKSRHVEIGWGGPPEIVSATKLLPDDWNESNSPLGSELEHVSAKHVAMPVKRARRKSTIENGNDNDVVLPQSLPPAPGVDDGEANETLKRLTKELEEALDTSFGLFDAEMQPGDRNRETDALSILQSIVDRHVALNMALASMLGELEKRFEPRLIEARVDASASRLSWNTSGAYWRSYRAQFERNGRMISVRDLFREAMSADSSSEDRGLSAVQKGNMDEE